MVAKNFGELETWTVFPDSDEELYFKKDIRALLQQRLDKHKKCRCTFCHNERQLIEELGEGIL